MPRPALRRVLPLLALLCALFPIPAIAQEASANPELTIRKFPPPVSELNLQRDPYQRQRPETLTLRLDTRPTPFFTYVQLLNPDWQAQQAFERLTAAGRDAGVSGATLRKLANRDSAVDESMTFELARPEDAEPLAQAWLTVLTDYQTQLRAQRSQLETALETRIRDARDQLREARRQRNRLPELWQTAFPYSTARDASQPDAITPRLGDAQDAHRRHATALKALDIQLLGLAAQLDALAQIEADIEADQPDNNTPRRPFRAANNQLLALRWELQVQQHGLEAQRAAHLEKLDLLKELMTAHDRATRVERYREKFEGWQQLLRRLDPPAGNESPLTTPPTFQDNQITVAYPAE